MNNFGLSGVKFDQSRREIIDAYDSPGGLPDFSFPDVGFFNWATDWFDVYAEGNGSLCLSGGNMSGIWCNLSYEELSDLSSKLAWYLLSSGVKPGNRIILSTPSNIEAYVYILALLKCGAVAILVHYDLHVDSLSVRLEVAQPDWLIGENEVPDSSVPFLGMADTFKRAMRYEHSGAHAFPSISADDPAFGCFSSGTAGTPKVVLHSHRSHSVAHLSSLFWSRLQSGDRHLNISSPGWAKFFWSSLLVPFTSGATVVIKPDDLPMSDLGSFLSENGVTSMCAPVPFLQNALRFGISGYSGLRDVTSVGEPLPNSLRRDIQEAWHVCVRAGFGQSEATGILGEFSDNPGVFHALPGYEVRLRKLANEAAARLEFRSFPRGSFVGYSLGRDIVPPEVTSDGWQWTGDFADGVLGTNSFRVLGRGDDVFRLNGHLVAPAEVEDIIRQHPDVLAAAVTKSFDEKGTVIAVASIVLCRDLSSFPTEQSLLDWVNVRLPSDINISSIFFVDSIPMSINGKIQRGLL